MGRLTAMAMTDEELGLTLEEQIGFHLRSNHFPPIPLTMVEPCIQAIDYANEGEWDKLVSLPEGIGYKGLTAAPVWAMIEQHHLETWIVESEFDNE
jgi:hypothetical protein